MKKITEAIAAFISILLVFSLGFATCYIWEAYKKSGDIVTSSDYPDLKLPGEVEKRIISEESITACLEPASELLTYTVPYTYHQTVDTPRYILKGSVRVPCTTNSIDFTCPGVVHAGYDFSKIRVSVDNVKELIYVYLPEPDIIYNELNVEEIICNEKNCILNPIEYDQYQELLNAAKTEGLKEAEENGIYTNARIHAEDLIRLFLAEFDYDIEFI